MTCRSDFAPYLSPEGFPCSTKNPSQPGGNALLFLAHYVYCLKRAGELTPEDPRAFYDIVTAQCQIIPGFFRRAKQWAQDLEARDDYYALAYLSRTLGWPVAKEILAFGRTHKFQWGPIKLAGYFPNTDYDALSPTCVKGPLVFSSGKNALAYLWRDRALLAATKWAAGEFPSPLEAAWWDWATAYSGSKTDQDGWLLGYLQHEIARGLPGSDPEVAQIFYGRLKREWGTLNAVFAAYLGDPSHPLVRWWAPPK